MKDTIINNEDSFKETISFLKKYFKKVKVVKNKNSELASRSQNFYTDILFKNRGVQFSIRWNYYNCTLYFGDNIENNCFQYCFTKMKFNETYPVEEMNNANVMFWSHEISGIHDDSPQEISPFRLPITLKKARMQK